MIDKYLGIPVQVDKELLEILACPDCKQPIEFDTLVFCKNGHEFKVRDDIIIFSEQELPGHLNEEKVIRYYCRAVLTRR